MSSYIVGLNIGNHDSSACLIKDGVLLSYAEQERFSRNKLALGEAPIEALKFCLNKERINFQDVSAVAIGMDWPYRNKIYHEPEYELKKYQEIDNIDRFLPKGIFGEKRPEVHYIRHHLAHASSAYRLSGFKDSAVLVIDNRGEDASSSLGIAHDGKIEFFKTVDIANSLGIFYNRACRFTGLYGKYREVGKFMGLASYGIPNMKMPVSPNRNGNLFNGFPPIENESIFNSIGIRTSQFEKYFNDNCFPYESGNSDEIMSYANFAASVQNTLELCILDFVKELKEKSSLDNLVISGGVALNCSANGKIEKSNIFKNIYIPPFASDAGTAIGAAMELDYMLNNRKVNSIVLHTASLGASYDDEEAIKIIKRYEDKLAFEILSDQKLYKKTAYALSENKIVGWMQGEFEAGPRALGYRSILADPRKRKNLIRLNQIKEREMWRPIAPSILYDSYSDYFEGSPDNKYFMNVATLVKKNMQHLVPAIVHVDETARPQVVTSDNQKYFGLINAFYKETGVPLLCNTSFNMKGVPLVNTPENAIECFLQRNIDVLVIGNIYITKK